jgi:Mg2+/Co2+ transporter CorC
MIDDDRSFAASLNAHRFMLELLWARVLHSEGENANDLIAEILRVAGKTDHLRAENEAHAEVLADVAVQTQQDVARILAGAMTRAGIK